jgi:hypothetical protein
MIALKKDGNGILAITAKGSVLSDFSSLVVRLYKQNTDNATDVTVTAISYDCKREILSMQFPIELLGNFSGEYKYEVINSGVSIYSGMLNIINGDKIDGLNGVVIG